MTRRVFVFTPSMTGGFATVVAYAVGLVMSPPDTDFGIVSKHEPICARLDRNPIDAHILPDQAVDHTIRQIAHARSFQHDAVLDLGVLNFDIVHDGRERTDVRMDDARATPDDRRSSNDRSLDHRAGFDDHLAFDAAVG